MSREIKFRAWAGGKMWYQGSFEFQQVGETILGSRSKFILWEFNGIESGENLFAPIDLDSEIPQLMQFTGLKDKNGREIYEGDKVFVVMVQTIGEDFRGEAVVEWSDHFGAWILDFPNLGQGIAIHVAEEIEVLGNIHESVQASSTPEGSA